eukprot:TRINITY_DN4117_c0_g1_i4.p1 TRINITY_DN4117_c0_g1~~TRINITY_DN4117_c0_g1_i4.p1  ORF type:complete len:430 (+),score=91.49 TRINITY_DN4117_c0_g1_i4:89-1378(+)
MILSHTRLLRTLLLPNITRILSRESPYFISNPKRMSIISTTRTISTTTSTTTIATAINDDDDDFEPVKPRKRTIQKSKGKEKVDEKEKAPKKTKTITSPYFSAVASKEKTTPLASTTPILTITDIKTNTSIENSESDESGESGPSTKVPNQSCIGGHLSISNGIENIFEDAKKMGLKSFGLFTGSQRAWKRNGIKPETAKKFKENMVKYGFTPNLILPHASYLINLGSPEPETLEKSMNLFVDELKAARDLGLTLYNFHPGSHCGKGTVSECIASIANCINKAHKIVDDVITVLEITAGQGSNVGCTFEQLSEIISLVSNKERVGVCLDTCHMFAAGYDISTKKGYKQVMELFDKVVGFRYLKGMHINDSKTECGSKKDRHENLGKGKLGSTVFQCIVNDSRLFNIPLVLETPHNYDEDLKLLRSFIEN